MKESKEIIKHVVSWYCSSIKLKFPKLLHEIQQSVTMSMVNMSMMTELNLEAVNMFNVAWLSKLANFKHRLFIAATGL